MSSKRKKTSMSESSQSGSGSDSNDGGAKKRKEGSSSGSSDEGGNKSRSGSGSDSGTERSRSRSGSRAGSRNSGKSNSSKSSDSGTEGSGRPGSKKASGGSSSGSSSSGSGKSKKLKKASSRKPSSKMETSTLSHDSDSDEEQNVEKPKRKKSESPRNKKLSDRGSSSDEETWRDQFDDGLNDELIGDEDDKRMLEDMTEKEREEEIFKRAEKREELKKRFEITKKLEKDKKKKNEDQEDGELKENLSDEEDMQMDFQTTGRKKKYEEKYDKKFSALNEIKAQREEKERKAALRKEKESKKKPRNDDSDIEKLASNQANKKVLKASDVYSSSSDEGKGEERRRSSSSSSSSSSSVSSISSGESDTERHTSKKLVKKAQIVDSQEQLESIRLSRHKIEKFVHLPIFKRTAIGCFVRIGIGNDPTSQNNKPVYRVAEIVEICETAKTYSVGKAKTNIGLKLKHGKDERVFRVAFVSNHPFSDSEFNKWKETCVKANIELPTAQIIATKANDINKALNYRFSSADVDKVLASKEKFKVNPVNYAVHKAKLQKEKLQHEESGNKEEADRIGKRLAEIEERAEELDRKRCSSISQIAYINNRNRKANIVKAEKAIYAEIKQKQIDGVDEDPFTRRRTAPKLPSAKKDENEGMTSELLLKLQQEKGQEKVKQEEVVEKKVPKTFDMPKALTNKPKMEIKNDLFDAHDFDVEINVSEIQQSSIPSSINLKPVNNNNANNKASNGPTKRSLKIDEWKKKRGII